MFVAHYKDPTSQIYHASLFIHSLAKRKKKRRNKELGLEPSMEFGPRQV
jgi:hypothetical protein